MTVKSRSRLRHFYSIVAVVLTLGVIAVACDDHKSTLGEDCIKGEDCQSGICTALKCTAAAPILDRDATPPAHDASTSDVTEAGEGGDAQPDSATTDSGDAEAGTD
jgi:hypothetical protein